MAVEPVPGRGSQVVWASRESQRASRGAAGRTMQENIAYKEYVEAIGDASDGNTVDGSTSTGLVAYDEVYARGGVFEANIGTSLPTDPTGLAPGDLYVNGGVLMVVMPFDTP